MVEPDHDPSEDTPFTPNSQMTAVVAGRILGPMTALTRRELEVGALASHGLSNRQMGRRMHLSEATVKFHLGRAREKIGAQNRMELAAWLWQTGLMSELTPDDWICESCSPVT